MFKEYEMWIWGAIGLLVVIILAIFLFIKLKQTKPNEAELKEIEIDETPKESIQEESIKAKTAPIQEEKAEQKEEPIQEELPVVDRKINKDDFKEFEGVKVLVAEDNIINQKVITSLLADSGIIIKIANNGQEALDILAKDDDYSIVLMDANMPVMDGFEATRNIVANEKYKHIVVIALSGDTAADDIRKMKEAGMQEHLEKPLHMNALYSVFLKYGKKSVQSDQHTEIIKKPTYVANDNLDTENGLEICGYDEQFYIDILNEFKTTYKTSSNKLLTMLKTKEFQEADKFLLDITGVSANIGANNLNKTTQNIKISLQNDKSKVANYLKEYDKQLKILLTEIDKYLNVNKG